jgi:hypothetical protein
MEKPKPNIIKYATTMVNWNIPEVTLSNLGQNALPLESAVFVPFAILTHITLQQFANFFLPVPHLYTNH